MFLADNFRKQTAKVNDMEPRKDNFERNTYFSASVRTNVYSTKYSAFSVQDNLQRHECQLQHKPSVLLDDVKKENSLSIFKVSD